MQKPKKIALEKLKSDMSSFLKFPEIEEKLLAEAGDKAKNALMSKKIDINRKPIDILDNYLTEKGFKVQDRLEAVVNLTGGSVERIKRIFEAKFPHENWGAFRSKPDIRREILSILLDPKKAETLIPEFIQRNIAIPKNWIELLTNEEYLNLTIINTLRAKYATQTGFALEEYAREIVSSCGYESEKGKVELVEDKEVDIAIPNTENPRILIMSSYNLTTASSQSSRSNEQIRMYGQVEQKRRYKKRAEKFPIYLVNIIDGGGWLARPKDLEKMWDECDFCFCYKNLNEITKVLEYVFAEN